MQPVTPLQLPQSDKMNMLISHQNSLGSTTTCSIIGLHQQLFYLLVTGFIDHDCDNFTKVDEERISSTFIYKYLLIFSQQQSSFGKAKLITNILYVYNKAKQQILFTIKNGATCSLSICIQGVKARTKDDCQQYSQLVTLRSVD